MARGLSCSHQLAGSGTRLDGVEDRENSICKENNGKQGGSFREVRGGGTVVQVGGDGARNHPHLWVL